VSFFGETLPAVEGELEVEVTIDPDLYWGRVQASIILFALKRKSLSDFLAVVTEVEGLEGVFGTSPPLLRMAVAEFFYGGNILGGSVWSTPSTTLLFSSFF